MAAQPGSSVLLAYGTQGAQQAGASVLLSYDQAQTGAVLVGSATRAPWDRSRSMMRPLSASYAAITVEDHGRRAPWAAAQARETEAAGEWSRVDHRDANDAAPWGAFGDLLADGTGSPWKDTAPKDDGRRGAWGAFGDLLADDHGARWKRTKAMDRGRSGAWYGFRIPTVILLPYAPPDADSSGFVAGAEYAMPAGDAADFIVDWFAYHAHLVDGNGDPILSRSSRDSVRLNPWGRGRKADVERIAPWVRFSRPLNPGWGVVIPSGPPAPEPGQSIIIPVQRLYIVVNEILITRADDSTPIPATRMSIGFDCDSWLPTFSATIPESARDIIMPDPSPVEVYAYINGSEFRFLVEKIQRSRQFAQRSVTISGRGIACELDAPYAVASQHTNGSTMTAQQIIDAALEFTTYTQTWDATDWSVPAGVFSLHGTPADVAAAVAEASGSVLAADWALRDLRMLPRYPVKPWEWATATPAYVIPADITQTESVEWIEKPDYNVVYVSGVTAGVLGQVKITGTAGDKPAPMVTHPLITHNDAARQRGISILADTGRKALMQISMPVLETTGVIDICRLIEFSDGANTRRGIVRANSVSVDFPTVRQTLTIEAAA